MRIKNTIEQQRNINHNVYWLLFITISIFLIIISGYLWQSNKSTELYTKIHEFHLVSHTKCLELTNKINQNKLFFLERYLGIKQDNPTKNTQTISPTDPRYLSKRDQMISFKYDINKIINDIEILQTRFNHPDFISVNYLLKQASSKVLEQIDAAQLKDQYSYNNIVSIISPLAAVTHQLQRLHQNAYFELNKELDEFSKTSRNNLIILATLLIAIGLYGIINMLFHVRRILDNLTTTQKELINSKDELTRYKNQLEEKVKIRTQDLEKFAYSVSHDLRSPLRGISGFSSILLEEYSNKLDNEGKDFLNRIHKATERMGQIIDDMTKLSRVNRDDMLFENVNLSALAEQAFTELQQLEPERKVKLIAQPELQTYCDINKFRILFNNLIGNAWKFTSGNTEALIEFGLTTDSNNNIYFVRDNGVGFDMRYADKLFQAFQRLHRNDEFQGTGIGLSIVDQVIKRHNGRIWAESEIGKGSTFYFTLDD